MDDLISLLLRPGTAVLALAVVILTFFTRKIVETSLPWWKVQTLKNKDGKATEYHHRYVTRWAEWWNEVILRAVPVLYGMSFGFINAEFLFGPANEKFVLRLMFGGGVAWVSGLLYKGVRKFIADKAGLTLPADDAGES